jgi:hypothetical protein
MELQHVLHQGTTGAPATYILNRKNMRDVEFFEKLAKTDLAPGTEIKVHRGSFDIRMKCISVDTEICEWEKVRS